MASLQARRSERIDYDAEVELLAPVDSTHAPRRVLAHAVDLGSGGMRVTAPAPMPIGAQVTCRVMLDGKPASLPGRVAWRRDAEADRATNLHGMGICFEPLGTYESGLLKHVVERSSAGYRAVELHFPGLDQPVVARARTRTDGLRLSAALPIFARDTELSFQLDEEGPVFTGRIGEAVLKEAEDGTRRIDIEVDVIEPEETGRYRRRARYGYAVEIEREEHVAAELDPSLAPTEPGTRDAPEVARTPRRAGARRGAWRSMLVAAAAGGALAWLATLVLQPRANEQDASEAFVARPRALGHAPAVVRSAELTTAEALPIALGVEPKPAPLPAAGGILHEVGRASAPDTRSTAARITTEPPNTVETAIRSTAPALRGPMRVPEAANDEIATSPTTVGEASVGEAPVSTVPDVRDLEPSGDTVAPQPETVLEDDATRVRLPFSGNLDGMRSVMWAQPLALAIDLPRGSTALALGEYSIGAGGVTDLRVNRRGDTLLIRVKLSSPIARYTITAEDGTLEARLVPLVQAP